MENARALKQQVQEAEDEFKRDREMLKTKLDAALRLPQHQNVISRTATSQGATADEALRRFQTVAPDVEDVLRVILESSGTSQSERTAAPHVVASRGLAPSIAPISDCISECAVEASVHSNV